jgi:hypothetical protein
MSNASISTSCNFGHDYLQELWVNIRGRKQEGDINDKYESVRNADALVLEAI